MNNDDIAALHVNDPWAARRIGINAFVLLEWAVQLEYRVEMPNHEDLGTATDSLRHKMTGTFER